MANVAGVTRLSAVFLVLRRKINQDSLAMFTLEMALLVPAAFFFLFEGDSLTLIRHSLDMWCILLPGLGALSTPALASYLKASRLLPVALFGILGYVEPVLLVLVSVTLLGETFHRCNWAPMCRSGSRWRSPRCTVCASYGSRLAVAFDVRRAAIG